MKKQNVLFGVILVGIGVFFLLNQLHITYFKELYTWPTILIFIGVAFILQSQIGRDPNSLFPGTLLLGLGIHFHAVHTIKHWPTGWPVYLFIIGLSFLVRYAKTKQSGLFTGVILIVLSLLGLFNQYVQRLLNQTYHYIDQLWPIALIVLGLYILFKKK